MLNLGRVTKVKVFFLVLVYVFNIDLFEFSAAVLEKGLFFISLPPFGGHVINKLGTPIVGCTLIKSA